MWDKEVNPHLFNLLLDHMTKDFKSLVEGRSKWNKTLCQQDGVELVRIIHALCHLRDDTKPGMPEIVAQDRSLFLCTQKQGQSEVDYLRSLQSTVDAINEAGDTAGVTPRSIELVCTEKGLVYENTPNDKDRQKRSRKSTRSRANGTSSSSGSRASTTAATWTSRWT